MSKTTFHALTRAFAVVAVATLVGACAGNDVAAPSSSHGPSARAPLAAELPELGACTNLVPLAGSELAFHAYADGVQIYHWTGTTWQFDAPSATLYADAARTGVVGTHFGGPTWKMNSGGSVVGATLDRCTPDANAIPWLILSAVSDGPGVFNGVNRIQRLYTTGGKAPASAGSFIGEVAKVPYTAEYFFYRPAE